MTPPIPDPRAVAALQWYVDALIIAAPRIVDGSIAVDIPMPALPCSWADIVAVMAEYRVAGWGVTMSSAYVVSPGTQIARLVAFDLPSDGP